MVSTEALEELANLSGDDEDEFGLGEEEELQTPEIQGYLTKWTNYIHGWQERYIVLKDGILSYYKSEDETAFGCRGAVSMNKANILVSTTLFRIVNSIRIKSTKVFEYLRKSAPKRIVLFKFFTI